jgi:hypothetical protein
MAFSAVCPPSISHHTKDESTDINIQQQAFNIDATTNSSYKGVDYLVLRCRVLQSMSSMKYSNRLIAFGLSLLELERRTSLKN